MSQEFSLDKLAFICGEVFTNEVSEDYGLDLSTPPLEEWGPRQQQIWRRIADAAYYYMTLAAKKQTADEFKQQALKVLNRALEEDSEAITKLIWVKVPCNEKLAKDPTIQVNNKGVGPLGLINGILGSNEEGYGFIAAEYETNPDRINRFIDFEKFRDSNTRKTDLLKWIYSAPIDREEFRKILLEILDYLEWSNTKLSVKLGCSESTIRRWKKGVSYPQLDEIRMLYVDFAEFVKES